MSKPISGTTVATTAGAPLGTSGILLSGVWIALPQGGITVEIIATNSTSGILLSSGIQFIPCANTIDVMVKSTGLLDQEVRYWAF